MTAAKPFESPIINCQIILNELCEFAVTTVMFHYANAWLPDKEFYGYAKFVIVTIFGLAVLNFLIYIIKFTIALLTFLVVACRDLWNYVKEHPPRCPKKERPATPTPPEEEDYSIPSAAVDVNDLKSGLDSEEEDFNLDAA